MYRALVLIGLGIQLCAGKNMSNQNNKPLHSNMTNNIFKTAGASEGSGGTEGSNNLTVPAAECGEWDTNEYELECFGVTIPKFSLREG